MFDHFVDFVLEHTWRKLSLGLRVGLQIPAVLFLAFFFSFLSNPKLTQPENFRSNLSALIFCYAIIMIWRLGLFKDTSFGIPEKQMRLYVIALMDFLVMVSIAMIFAIIESQVFVLNYNAILEANLLFASILQCFSVVKEARCEEQQNELMAQMHEKYRFEQFSAELDAEAEALSEIYTDLNGWIHKRGNVLYENDEDIMVVIPRHEISHTYR